MKYLVMECHKGFAVVMDEESRFFKAANMHYEVGQTVTDPMILKEEKKKHSKGRMIVMKITAAAACIAVLSVVGVNLHAGNDKMPHSVLLVSSAADIEMELDSKGNVVTLKSRSERGKEMLRKYNSSRSRKNDKVDTANDIIEFQIENGYISSGDTVDLFIAEDDAEKYDSYKEEFETELPKLDIKVNVQKAGPDEKLPEPPAPLRENADKAAVQDSTAPSDAPAPEKPAAPHDAPDAAKPAAPAEKPAEPAKEKTSEPEPQTPNAERPEPPADNKKPEEAAPPVPTPPIQEQDGGIAPEAPKPEHGDKLPLEREEKDERPAAHAQPNAERGDKKAAPLKAETPEPAAPHKLP